MAIHNWEGTQNPKFLSDNRTPQWAPKLLRLASERKASKASSFESQWGLCLQSHKAIVNWENSKGLSTQTQTPRPQCRGNHKKVPRLSENVYLLTLEHQPKEQASNLIHIKQPIQGSRLADAIFTHSLCLTPGSSSSQIEVGNLI